MIPEYQPEGHDDAHAIAEADSSGLSRESTTTDMDPDFEGEREDSTHTGVPSVLEEPDVPDPFIVDDGSEESDSSSDESESPHGPTDHSPSPAAEDNIALAQSVVLEQPVDEGNNKPLPSPNINKSVPPPPPESVSDEDDEEEPELYLPGLIIPTMFLPIPNVRPLRFCVAASNYDTIHRPTL